MVQSQFRLLLSEAHGERLRPDGPEAELPCARWAEALEKKGFHVDHNEAVLTEQELEKYDVLVLGSPVEQLGQSEIATITGFVRRGGGLLLVNDAEAVRSQAQNLSGLEKMVLCQFREYLNAFPTAVETFRPHYVTAGLDSLTVTGNCRLVPSSEEARSLAVIPETGESFALCGEVDGGRVIAVADSAPFTDEHWGMGSNGLFAIQCCLWLARRNPVDLNGVAVDSPIELGGVGTFLLTLGNPRSEALRHVRCTLEANTDTAVTEGSQEVRVIPPLARVSLRWRLQPRALGPHQLRLAAEAPADAGGHAEILFSPVAEFMCTAPVNLKLEITDCQGQPKSTFTTGERFRVEGSTEWRASDVPQKVPLELHVPDAMEVLQEEQFGSTVRWYLQGNTPGYYDVSVAIPGTGQNLTAGVGIRPSLDWQRENIETEYVEPLNAEIVRRLVRVHPAFGDESIGQIPFRVLSPEEYIEVVYPSPTTCDHFRDVLASGRRETRYNLRLLNEILLNIAPIYSPRYGASAPFDPELASHWTKLHPTERQSLLYNFLQLEDSAPTTIQQNVAAYLLHEKYGHGFFFAHTRLGQQLAILDRYLFLRDDDEELLAIPYPRTIRQQYAEAIRALDHSSMIVNEGFAAWLELDFLAQMESEIAAAAHPRRVFLIWRAKRLYGLIEESSYFQQFRPLFDSPYQEGCEKLEAIQRVFGDHYGEKCALQVFLKATDISLGVKEGVDGPEFSLSSEEMFDALTNPERPDDARSDRRLRRIFKVLMDSQAQLRSEQRRLQCHRGCLHPACPVHTVIAKETGW